MLRLVTEEVERVFLGRRRRGTRMATVLVALRRFYTRTSTSRCSPTHVEESCDCEAEIGEMD